MDIQHFINAQDVSAQELVRRLVSFLTTEMPKPGFMHTVVWSKDDVPSTQFGPLPICYILKQELTTDGSACMYSKIILDDKGIRVLVSGEYVPAKDNNVNFTLTGSWKSLGEDTNDVFDIYDNASNVVTPKSAKIPTAYFPSGFDPLTKTIDKVWLVRKLGPKFDTVGLRKLTDSFAWVTFCFEENKERPLDKFGMYNHFGWGCAGDQLVPDKPMKNTPCLYSVVGSYAYSDKLTNSADRVFAGSGSDSPASPTSNLGGIIKVGEYMGKNVWAYCNSQYGYVRKPFDEPLFVFGNVVGYDFTEMCKLSPYSGVRTLTPAYVFGMYDDLYKIIARLPITYTSLEGLYAGDMISNETEGVVKSWMVFPFIQYKCLGDPGAKRGYAIPVPPDETV